jgi:peptidoglycan/xylan/chitin deacetylase (PgdA/CDA1 family)
MRIFLISLSVICFCFGTGYKNKATKLVKQNKSSFQFEHESGAIIRGDTNRKDLALVFTGDEFADGGEQIISVLSKQQVPGSFFFTGNFYRNPAFEQIIRTLHKDGHYLGAHSEKHLLYCDWNKRDSLLVTRDEFIHDLRNNYRTMKKFGISKKDAHYFLPPYEWYNDSISNWTNSLGLQLINYTPGTLSHADYTTPEMQNYRSSEVIYRSIIDFEKESSGGLSGFILLTHIGTSPERKDKFYDSLDVLIKELKNRGYNFSRIDKLLSDSIND